MKTKINTLIVLAGLAFASGTSLNAADPCNNLFWETTPSGPNLPPTTVGSNCLYMYTPPYTLGECASKPGQSSGIHCDSEEGTPITRTTWETPGACATGATAATAAATPGTGIIQLTETTLLPRKEKSTPCGST